MFSQPLHEQRRLAGRFQIGETLGTGGFGEVSAGVDLRSGSKVAIKRLLRLDPKRLLLFKREFRQLADIHHQNLLRYIELIEEQGDWYLVMEYISGTVLLPWLRADEAKLPDLPIGFDFVPTSTVGSSQDGTPPTRSAAGVTMSTDSGNRGDLIGPPEASYPPLHPRRLERLLGLLPQLVSALTHLHSAGTIHCDLTPRNLMVDAGGRLVVLDFGLAQPRKRDPAAAPQVMGTVSYMAPEQICGDDIGPAADWYGVGSVLFEALTGRVPFTGTSTAVSQRKLDQRAPDPRSICAGIPDDFAAVVMALLATAPADRPTDAARRLLSLTRSGPSGTTALPLPASTFVGRSEQVGLLSARIRAADGGVMLLHGPSGIGKSDLLRHACERGGDDRSVFLRSRCYQHESLPFKGLDGLIDAVAEHMKDSGAVAVDDLVLLSLLFPTLRRVVGGSLAVAGDPREWRRRAFRALRDLFAAWTRLYPELRYVLVIDDIQWSDQDSIAALTGILAPPSPPPVLLLLSARTDDDQGRAAQLIRDAFAEAGIAGEDLPIRALTAADLGQLAAQLDPHADAGRIAAWCRDSAGSPLMLREIVAANRLDGAAGASLTDLLGLRLAALTPRERRLVEAVAIAGSPQPISTLSRVLGTPDDLIACAHRLDSARLLRWRGGIELGLHHDKIGETALNLLSPARRRECHVRFAEVLSEQGDAAAAAVFEHWMAADRPERALGPGMQAATHAERTFAFVRAAELFARLDALVDPGERRGLRRRQAEALANAGRGTAAARIYAGLAGDPSVPDRSLLRRLAAFHFLRSGSVLDGLSNAREALAEVGERWISHPGWVVARIIWTRLGLRLRGYRFEERPGEPPLGVAERADALWSLSRALAPVDTLRAVELHLRHLPDILAHGDLPRVVRAIAWEAMLLSTESTVQRPTAQALLGRAQLLADRLGRPRVLAEVVAARSYCARFDGRLPEALELASASIAIYRSSCQDIAWEIGSILVWCRFPALAWCGRLAELRRECDEAEREFEGYGDRYTLVTLRAGLLPWLLLAEGRPDDAERSIAAARTDWTTDGWHLQHLLAGLSSIRLALYRGDHGAALSEIAALWPRMRSSGQVFNQWYHADVLLLHGTAALRTGDHRLAKRLARQLASVGHPWAKTHAAVMMAGALALTGDRQRTQRLVEAAAAYDQAGLAMYAAAARLGAYPGDGPVAGVLTAMGVSDPQRWAETLLPLALGVARPTPRP